MEGERNCISAPFHWSGEVLAITIVTLIVLMGAGFHLESLKWPAMMLWLKYLLIIVFLATVVIGVGYMPIRLEADDETILIRRLFGTLEVSLSEVIEIRGILKTDIDHSIRTFGSGGLFGYLGRFKNDRLGSYTMYATALNQLVLIRTKHKKYVFSCSCAKELIEYVNLRLQQKSDVQNVAGCME